jgi:hypothetical protein
MAIPKRHSGQRRGARPPLPRTLTYKYLAQQRRPRPGLETESSGLWNTIINFLSMILMLLFVLLGWLLLRQLYMGEP